MVFMIESQVEYIVQALRAMKREFADAIEVRPHVERAYNERIQQKLGRTIWSTGGCKSWYLDPRTGKNTTLWPGFAYRFRQATATFNMADYFAWTQPPAVRPATPAAVTALAENGSGGSTRNVATTP
jgi:hypothetical protein